MKHVFLVITLIFTGTLVGAAIFGDSASLRKRTWSVGLPAVSSAAFYLCLRLKEKREP